ncbi:MAG: Asd/ArgC dimerization domain-containing protein [Terriglobia bacterium]
MMRDTRVAMAGAGTLLGKEILSVLKERNFPASNVVELESRDEPPEIAILDAGGNALPVLGGEQEAGPFDFIFVAAAPKADGEKDLWTERLADLPASKSPFVIDAAHGLPEPANATVSIPFLGQAAMPLAEAAGSGARFFISPHTAAIALSSLIVPVARRIKIERVIAQIFNPASELGPAAIEELQKQTVNLLSFQQMPREIFDAQMAFNLAPRLGRKARAGFASQEARVRSELRRILEGRAPVPSIRLIQVPMFYSLALSLYVQAAVPVKAAQVEEALSGDRIRLLRASHAVPSPPEVQGSATVLVDPVVIDQEHAGGFWLWAMADNLRLAAANAVEIAENLLPLTVRP